MKIVHIADIHWRGLSRHKEYRESFEDFYKSCYDLDPDIIYVGGDIVHNKTQGISPELIDCLSEWFNKMAEICPVHVILGNHDGLMNNKDRQDAITPIVSALDNPKIHLYKKSGVYDTGVTGFKWCIFSCFDQSTWSLVNPDPEAINLALFHGAVIGSETDVSWMIEGEDSISVDFFDDYDFALLGDIHKCQFLNNSKTIAYCGSSVQQNYGEDIGKGFLFWDIRSKNDFDVSFHQIYHGCPFVTIDWCKNVKNTFREAKKHPAGSRFRIKSVNAINQADMQQISERLRVDMKAAEVVFKSDTQFDPKSYEMALEDNSEALNLRDIKSQIMLFNNFFENSKLLDEDLEDISRLVESYLASASENEEILRNSRWEINTINFDNLFAYGGNNFIDFKNNPGITGIFGKNTKGKSSIIGSLMYCLFNTTDRGPVKNLHIINSRMGSCKASIDISLNGELFRIKRGTVKHSTRKGDVYASTSLVLQKINSAGEVVENLTGEQRRETEKILRRMIGASEDFSMTSLASQGGMNNFINEGSSSRKTILTKFLDLEIFDKMNDLCKQDSSNLRAILKSMNQVDWSKKIGELEVTKIENKKDLDKIEIVIKGKRDILDSLRLDKNFSASRDIVTKGEILDQKKIVENLSKKIKSIELEIIDGNTGIGENLEKSRMISEICDAVSIESLKAEKDAIIEIEKDIILIKGEKKRSENELKRLDKSASQLKMVPCGDKFPTCMFIKSSHQDSKRIKAQSVLVKDTISILTKTKKSLQIIRQSKPNEKIEKHEALMLKKSLIEVDIDRLRNTIESLEERVQSIREKLIEDQQKLESMKLRLIDNEADPRILVIKKSKEIKKEIASLEEKRVFLIEKIASIKYQIGLAETDRDRFNDIRSQIKTYDLFLQASSKKGIPSRIMLSRLPFINREISDILLGVVDFTVIIEPDPDTQAMEIYIDYGDSKRVIELASGMEKMISSLAIRVALINTSSLTKTNMIIIDEGFGSLDESNLEACTRLLESLKKWFRNILVISHVDVVKDCVDNSIEIVKRGKDSYVNHR
tara:strand:+ start:79439 stop:82582 length:3144 start_codon:yes stop_codon:yes gene_type:complete